MKNLLELTQRNIKNVIGIMSGTSLNGIDVVLINIEGNGKFSKIKVLGYIEQSFPDGLKNEILSNSSSKTSAVDKICKLNFILPHLYHKAINKLLKKINFDISDVDLIGCHGQTIYHSPQIEEMFGVKTGSTLQIGDNSVLAKLTQKIVIGNFRSGDIAFNGQGAPLVPYFDYLIYNSAKKNRILLNIGGISNFTFLKRSGDIEDVIAFDCGPGNMLIDLATKRYFNKQYDEGGKIAIKGKLDDELFSNLKKIDTFIEADFPKSTGREYYNREFLDNALLNLNNLKPENVLNTLTAFTAYSVYRNYEKFLTKFSLDEILVSGGGALNNSILGYLKEFFGKKVEIKKFDDNGITAESKEAVCFALLANEAISGNKANISSITGARKRTVLGSINLP